MKFPKRFEIEGIDPLTVKCKLVDCENGCLFELVLDCVEIAANVVDLSKFYGPMSDKHDGKWCVRFESKSAYKALSA